MALQICNCVLMVKDQSGKAYGNIAASNPLSAAELSFYTRKSQVHSGDSLYISKTMRSQAQPGVVVQDLLYVAVPSPMVIPTIAYTGGGTAGSEVVTVTMTNISIQIQSGVSTATQIQTAFNASPAAVALAYCILSGVGSNPQVTAAVSSFANEYCYMPLAETTTDNQQGIFQLVWNDGSNYDSIIFDPTLIPAQSFQDLSALLTVSRG